MKCAMCSADNREGLKFCTQCGSQLAAKCRQCGAATQPGERFCGECGAGLGTTEAAAQKKSVEPQIRIADALAPGNREGERKTVTVLFADIKGSMELIEDLDPEEARAIIDPALKLMIEAVERYGGYVAQSTGDGIFALFGAPVAYEDHPQRALLAALWMQTEVKRYAEKLRAEKGVNLQARVGANTGEVVVREIRTGEKHSEYVPIGHSTSVAARLQALAAPGSIAISEALRKLVEGYFGLRSLGPARIKGVSEPLEIYEVTGLGPLRTRLQRGAARGYTKFVGRQREMETLKHAGELAQAGLGQIVAAVAEPGVGKSRLFFEFKAKNQSGWMVLEAFSVSHGKASAYLPVLDLLHLYFDIKSEDDARKRREKVAGKITVLDRTLEDALPYLFALLGIVEGEDALAPMDAQLKKRRTLDAIKRILLRESLNQPIIVMFEDLHWIDEPTQEFLNLLADSLANTKLLLLVNYRPDYSHSWGSKTYYTQLRLDSLATESADEMLSALLGDSPDLGALKRLIIERTEGNPFFMEEMYQAMLEDGVIARNGAVKPVKPLQSARIPTTVQGVLAARIDRLPPDAKDLLQALAVIGREFPLSLIRAVVSKPEDEINRLLGDLQLGEFIYEQPALRDTEYSFKHALTQEVAYNSVLIERRKQLDERAGQALEVLYAEHLDDHLGELAQHYSRSGNLTKAVDYLGRAGEQATSRSAFQEAKIQLNRALEFVAMVSPGSDRDSRELSLRLALIHPMRATGLFFTDEESRANLERARVLCAATDEGTDLAFVLASLTNMYWSEGNLRKASQLVSELRLLAEANRDELLDFYANYEAGLVDAWMGRFRTAVSHCERALSIRERLVMDSGDGGALVTCRFHTAWSLWMLGYPDRSLSHETVLLDLLREPVDLFTRAEIFQSVLATHCHFLRDYRSMRERAESLVAIASENGFPFYLGCGLVRLGRIKVEEGDFDAGIETMLEGMRTFRSVGTRVTYDYFCCVLTEAFLEAGRAEEGMVVLSEAIPRSAAQEQRFCEAEMHRLKGELLLVTGATHDAEKAMRESIVIARGQEAKSWELRATTSLARLLRDNGRPNEARAMLAEIYGWFTEGFDTADLKDAKALLDELSA